jgi:hypothetical protein
VVVSLATQSILGCLPIDGSQVGVVGEMVLQFQKRAKWCSHLKATSLEVCNLVHGPVDAQERLAAGRLRVMQDEVGALRGPASQTHGPVLGVLMR